MKAIIGGKIILPDSEVKGKALLFEDKVIGIVDEKEALAQADEVIDAQGAYVCPGLVDVHIHGYLGADTSDADKDGVRLMARGVLANGVTSFLPTTMTVEWDILDTVFKQLRELKEESLKDDFEGAEILGCHAEGPFINPSKKGAQKESAILAPDAAKVLPFKDIISIITYAPEMEGGMAFTRELKQNSDIQLSIGHTSATYDVAKEAMGLGITRVTHTFNAQTPLHHRDPGVVGAALTSDVYCELIADTFHVNKGLFTLMDKAKGNKLVLITDCTRAGGLEDGEYTLGGQPIFVKGIECRLADGTIAGSVLKLNNAVRNYRDNASIPMWKAVRAATLNAAESAGVADRKGSLESGKDADITLMDEDCQVVKTFVRGNLKYSK
ncbi:MAG: N-acetylglucosamine-6-phosphate deacetylase [Clostridiales bacterium]|nr:N-acetylglucosamine-6-phosphate deacetylase [Clostridiales bacterium]